MLSPPANVDGKTPSALNSVAATPVKVAVAGEPPSRVAITVCPLFKAKVKSPAPLRLASRVKLTLPTLVSTRWITSPAKVLFASPTYPFPFQYSGLIALSDLRERAQGLFEATPA